MLPENTFLKPIQRLYTTYHLWDCWTIDTNTDGVQTLAVDETDQVMLYSPLKRVYRNKSTVSVLIKQEDGSERIILLDPQLELSEVIDTTF